MASACSRSLPVASRSRAASIRAVSARAACAGSSRSGGRSCSRPRERRTAGATIAAKAVARPSPLSSSRGGRIADHVGEVAALAPVARAEKEGPLELLPPLHGLEEREAVLDTP